MFSVSSFNTSLLKLNTTEVYRVKCEYPRSPKKEHLNDSPYSLQK